jgi:bifunctional non-homologous end joining protein LigD
LPSVPFPEAAGPSMAMITGENAQTCGPGFLYAFDLIEINGDDLRREPLEVRTATLASVLAKAAPGLRLNEHIEADGPTVFAHACKGIVSKRKASSYR